MAGSASKKALVVGHGVAGLAVALKLHSIGWDVTVIEKAPARRRGGHFMSLFGAGVAAAERLGIDTRLPDRTTIGGGLRVLDRQGRMLHELPPTASGARRLVRDDIEDAVFGALPDAVRRRYASSPVAIREDADGVDVDILDQATGATVTERFYLLVGADGLRSTVRRLVFGSTHEQVRRLGYMVAAFGLTEKVPGFDPKDTLKVPEDGRSAWVFAFENHPSSALLSYRTNDVDAEFTRLPIESLRKAFGPEEPGPVIGWLLDRFEATDNPLFDSAEQIHLDRWHTNRIVLVGDAAWCLTLYSGMGASSALAGADLLGTMLERHAADGIGAALHAWEKHLRPFIRYHAGAGVIQRAFFTPKSRTERLLQTAIIHVSRTQVGGKFLRWKAAPDLQMKGMDIAAVA